jgi:CRP/FNR family transcriptional regulator
MMVPAGESGETEANPSNVGVNGGVQLRWRRGYSHRVGDIGDDVVFLVETGCVICDAPLSSGRRHVLLVLFPGDALCRRFVPLLPDLQLTAVAPSSVLRFRRWLSAEPASFPVDLAGIASQLLARSCLYATARGRLSAEECLATLLADVALRLGRPIPGGYAFDLPLSRRDMADYLGLNPDSLSRLMSRFKQKRLIAMASRSRVIARDLDALLAATPFGETLKDLAAGHGIAPARP